LLGPERLRRVQDLYTRTLVLSQGGKRIFVHEGHEEELRMEWQAGMPDEAKGGGWRARKEGGGGRTEIDTLARDR
jgi:hypothetical protein